MLIIHHFATFTKQITTLFAQKLPIRMATQISQKNTVSVNLCDLVTTNPRPR